jgi:cation:H+ antiporter
VTVGPSVAVFVVGAVVSLATSWVLVTRLERVGERMGFSEASLGMVAALAADTPEITASITAIAHHQQTVGAGVVLGSNVFNLAALLGLGAVVAGRIELHRRVIVLGGTVAMLIAVACLLSVGGQVSAGVGLSVVLAVLLGYVTLLAAHRSVLARLRLPETWSKWLNTAIVEEESELEEAIRAQRGTAGDALTAAGALMVVLVASVAMEQGASALGTHFGIPEIVVGGLVLAAVTSLPNAVSAVYLARRGRGAAALSTALNSNSLNVAAGLLIPAVVIGLAKPSSSGVLVASWYVGLTALTLLLAHIGRGLGRLSGSLIILAYLGFVVVLLATT